MCFALGEAWRAATFGQRARRLLEAGVPFIPSAVCFLWLFGKSVSGMTVYGVLLDKTLAVLIGMLTYGRWPDVVTSLAVIAVLWLLERGKRIAIAPEMRLPAIVLLLTAIAMPSVLLGVFGADFRLPVLLYFLLVAASRIRLEERRKVIGFAMGVLALLGLRVVTLTMQWSQFDANYREFRAAGGVLERGSRVAVIPIEDEPGADPRPLTPYWFISCLAVVDRQILLPQIFTVATPLKLTAGAGRIYSDTLARQRIVRWQPADAAFRSADAETVHQVEHVGQLISDNDTRTSTIDWSDWPEQFDYVIDFDYGDPKNPVPALLTDVWHGSYFTIYRIHAPQHG
jgi:hypothetical protein